MSINWVMLAPTSQPPYTPLPGEQTLYTSPPRVAFSINIPKHYPGKQQDPFSISSSSGVVYLTSRRIIYLPATPTDILQSFATPFLNLHDSHVTAPFFGPNYWQALLQPVNGGGIPVPGTGVVELKLMFKDGGAFDYHSKFEQLKERAQHVQEISSMGADGQGHNLSTRIDLEDLPVYREENEGPLIPPIRPIDGNQASITDEQDLGASRTTQPPSEPPPGYEEAQAAGVHGAMQK